MCLIHSVITDLFSVTLRYHHLCVFLCCAYLMVTSLQELVKEMMDADMALVASGKQDLTKDDHM
jgi:hypothetical protein